MVSNIEVMEVGIGNFTEDKKDNEELPMKMGVVFCISSSSSVFAIFVFFVWKIQDILLQPTRWIFTRHQKRQADIVTRD